MTDPLGAVTAFTSDGNGNLLTVTDAGGGVTTYTYDKAGRRITTGGSCARTGIPQAISTATYSTANQQLTLGNRSMTYDLDGNLTALTDPSGTTTYTRNARNQLVSLSGPGLTASFQYDAIGRRYKRSPHDRG